MKIHEYAAKGDCNGVRCELARQVAVDARDERDYTPLMIAVENAASDEMFQLLVESGANVNSTTDDGEHTCLELAARTGNLSVAEYLLGCGADIHFQAPKGYSILLNTVFALHDNERLVPMIELLHRHGANSNSASEYGESPLSVASHLGRYDAVRYLLEIGTDPSSLCWTEFMRAVAIGTCDDVTNLLSARSVLHEQDRWDRTPWLLSIVARDLEKAKLLLAAGANINDQDRGGQTALMISATSGETAILLWLIEEGADVEATDGMGKTALMLAAQAGQTESVKLLLKNGADPYRQDEFGHSVISMATNEEIIPLLLAAGEDLNEIDTELKRKLLGLQDGEKLNVTQAEYKSGCRPRFGKSNPEIMNIPLWKEMVRSGVAAYNAKTQFGDAHNMAEPTWCFSRFGISFTELPDGRFVQIGGEHEDYYDPDFCIYNDVVVHERGGKFQIMGYPKEVFPPTDFHSATFVEGFIYIIGGLGYWGERAFGFTPIYRLNCRTWKMESLNSSGECPGWIYKHKASLTAPGFITIAGGKICKQVDGEEQHVLNEQNYRLDLKSLEWTRG